MPERKGRKRRAGRERRGSGSVATGEARETPTVRTSTSTGQAKPIGSSIPALRVRYFAFIVAVLTLFLGILTLAQGVLGDYATADAALRIGAGIILIAVALVIGVLALFPARIAARLRR